MLRDRMKQVRVPPPAPRPEPAPILEVVPMGRLQRNLWLSALTIKIEPVKRAHRKGCVCCKQIPTIRRLIVKTAGRRGITNIYCIGCGSNYLEEKQREAQRAWMYLRHGTGCIRESKSIIAPPVKKDES